LANARKQQADQLAGWSYGPLAQKRHYWVPNRHAKQSRNVCSWASVSWLNGNVGRSSQ